MEGGIQKLLFQVVRRVSRSVPFWISFWGCGYKVVSLVPFFECGGKRG